MNPCCKPLYNQALGDVVVPRTCIGRQLCSTPNRDGGCAVIKSVLIDQIGGGSDLIPNADHPVPEVFHECSLAHAAALTFRSSYSQELANAEAATVLYHAPVQ